MKVYSFDIFDTCLVRKCGKAENLFELLALRVCGIEADMSIKRDFVLERKRAEQRARQSVLAEEITLDDIYEQIDLEGLTTCNIEYVKQAEFDLEAEMLVGVQSVRDKIKLLRQQQVQIAFVSDMYLPQDFIKTILIREQFLEQDDWLYVSSEYGLTKEKGSLFQKIAEEHNLNICDWWHYGDNPNSDKAIPAKIGIHAVLLQHPLTPTEVQYRKSDIELFPVGALLVGATRALRLSQVQSKNAEFITNLVYPLFVSFTYIVMQEAQARNIKRLYFLARDGYSLYRIAQRLQPLFPEIEVHYLYASRKSLYTAGITTFTQSDLYELLHKNIGVRLRDALDVWSIGEGDLPDALLEQTIEQSSLQILCDELIEANLCQTILSRAEQMRATALGYFQQEGIASNISSAIVDIRGTRRSHQQLNRVLELGGYNRVFAFYMEVFKDRTTIREAGDYFAAVFDEQEADRLAVFYRHPDIVEQVFAVTDQQRTIGYQQNTDGSYSPIFDKAQPKSKPLALAGEIQEGLFRAADFYLQTSILSYAQQIFCLSLGAINNMLAAPTKQMLEPLVDFPISESQLSSIPYVKKYTSADYWRMLIFSNKLYRTNWFEADICYNTCGVKCSNIYIYI